MICPWCGSESTPIGCGDEVLDYCSECERVIEGETERMTPHQIRQRRREAICMYRNWAWWRALASHNYRVATAVPRRQ